MKHIRLVISTIFILALTKASATINDPLVTSYAKMNPHQLVEIIKSNTNNFTATNSVMRFSYRDVPMHCIYDEQHDRMRIIAAVTETDKITFLQYSSITEANFHNTLDARYASSNGILYAAFLHPLSTLEQQHLLSALRQVSELVKNFGTSYSSGSLSFNPK